MSSHYTPLRCTVSMHASSSHAQHSAVRSRSSCCSLTPKQTARYGSLGGRCAHTYTRGSSPSPCRHARVHRSSRCCRSYATRQPGTFAILRMRVTHTISCVLSLWRHARIHRAAGTAAPQQRCNPVRLACRRVRIHPRKQSCAVSRVSCVHAQTQPVPLLLSNDVDRYTVSASIYVPVRVFVLCPRGVMRTYSGATLAAAPQRRRSPVRLTSRQVRIHQTPGLLCLCTVTSAHRSSMCCRSYATTQPEAACAAAPQQRRRPEQHVLPTLNDGATRRVLYLWRHAHIHRSSWSCCPSQRTGTACLSPRAHTPIREAVR
jgi:hypothetical protein